MLHLKVVRFTIIILAAFAPIGAAKADGAQLYQQHCQSCHQADGWGVPFLAAPLAESPMVNEDPDYLAWFVIVGSLAIEDRASDYAAPMPPFGELSDHELAEILTYIRSSFGNSSGEISTQDIAAARAR